LSAETKAKDALAKQQEALKAELAALQATVDEERDRSEERLKAMQATLVSTQVCCLALESGGRGAPLRAEHERWHKREKWVRGFPALAHTYGRNAALACVVWLQVDLKAASALADERAMAIAQLEVEGHLQEVRFGCAPRLGAAPHLRSRLQLTRPATPLPHAA
jgi:hypothetical protein